MVSNQPDLGEKVRRRIETVNRSATGSIVEMLHFEMQAYLADRNEIVFLCETKPWMRNSAGTLHGGLCATILDQAMGYVAYCLKPGEGTAPAVQLKVDYHRPIHPGEQVLVGVSVLSQTKSLVHLIAQAHPLSNPEKLSFSGSGIYFYKPED